jgi:hypothetical protein
MALGIERIVMPRFKTRLLTANSVFLIVTGLAAFVNDLLSYFLGIGMFGDSVLGNPLAIGQTEAHALAVLAGVSVLASRAAWPGRYWHWQLLVLHAVLGGCNIVLFKAFTVVDLYAFGFVITTVHFVFIAAHWVALLHHHR